MHDCSDYTLQAPWTFGIDIVIQDVKQSTHKLFQTQIN
jgi:hypothetical protein